ncbi:hypothetical protein [Paracidovorax wautersii]|uniref:Uncharacterized protein n=1 Tax=Paracidovorax wautersii TaxID=1177982 RepID=A0A1I2GYN0_9BURK|nr:hypothetical protein [Paracidovorax wautersii]SFF22169.1 hypothetical protein SAMN04489711_11787 [Paracidovorax wautersii]
MRRLISVALGLILTGCSSLPEHVSQSLSLAEACQDLEQNKTASLPMLPSQFGDLIQARLRAETYCLSIDGVGGLHSLIECSLADLQMKVKVQGESVSSVMDTELAKLAAAVKEQDRQLADAGKDLRAAIVEVCGTPLTPRNLASISQCYLSLLHEAPNRPAIAKAQTSLSAAYKALAETNLRVNQARRQVAVVHGAADTATIAIAKDMAQFSAAVDRHVADARTALAGDISAATADTLLASLVYQRAYRLFDFVDQSLHPIELLIDRGNAKLYGTVSLSMAAFGTQIQEKVTSGMEGLIRAQVMAAYKGGAQTRLNDQGKASPLWIPLGIAACERLSDPKVIRKSPTLQPFVEHGLALAVKNVMNMLKSERSEVVLAASQVASAPESAEKALPTEKASPPEVAADYSPGLRQTYLSAQWAVRQAMTPTTAAQMVDDKGAVVRAEYVVGAVDEALIRRSALALSSSMAISEDARKSGISFSPGMAVSAAMSLSVAQATASASASANSNSTSTNTQNLYVTAPAPAAAAPAKAANPAPVVPSMDLCAVAPAGSRCMRLGDSVFRFDVGPFAAKLYSDEDLRQSLLLIASAAKASGNVYKAEVIGNASVPSFDCKQLQQWLDGGDASDLQITSSGSNGVQTYRFTSREDPNIFLPASCAPNTSQIDGNRALARARAVWAAGVLSKAAVKVPAEGIAGQGTLNAAKRDSANDRNVRVVLSASK